MSGSLGRVDERYDEVCSNEEHIEANVENTSTRADGTLYIASNFDFAPPADFAHSLADAVSDSTSEFAFSSLTSSVGGAGSEGFHPGLATEKSGMLEEGELSASVLNHNIL